MRFWWKPLIECIISQFLHWKYILEIKKKKHILRDKLLSDASMKSILQSSKLEKFEINHLNIRNWYQWWERESVVREYKEKAKKELVQEQ